MSPADHAHALARTGQASALAKLCKEHPGLINRSSQTQGGTPLHTAARYGNARTAHHMLTELGANPQLKDQNGKRPIDIAAQSGHASTTKLFEEATHPKIQLEIMRLEKEVGGERPKMLLQEPELRRLEAFEPVRAERSPHRQPQNER